jgi:fibronectin-binding autotransporter adhesin
MKPTLPRGTRAALLTCAVFCTTAFQAQSATITKADNTDALNLTTSWVGGVAPTAADTALWDSTVTGANSSALGANLAVYGVQVTSPGGAIALTGNTLTTGKGGIDLSAATQDLTISSGLTVGSFGRQTWSVANGRTLTLGAAPNKPGLPAGGNTGSLLINTVGSGAVKFNGITTAANIIIDPQNNPYATLGLNDWAGYDATGKVVATTYTNATTTLTAGVVNDIKASLTGANATDVAGLRFNESTAYDVTIANSATSRTATLRGILVTANATAGGSIGGNLRTNAFIRPNRTTGNTGGASFNIIQNSPANFTIGANITDGSTSTPAKLVKSGTGTLVILLDIGHTGGTYIDQGTIQYGNGTLTTGFPGSGDIVNNGSIVFNKANTTPATLIHNISGTGSFTQAGPGELDLTTSVSTFTGDVNITGGTLGVTAMSNLGAAANINISNGATLKFLAAIDPTTDTTPRNITVGTGGAAFDTNSLAVSLGGSFGGSTAETITKKGAGTMTLGASNSWTGSVAVNAGSLSLGNTSGSATGTAAISVASGASLTGAGSASGTAQIASGGSIDPGNAGVGTVTVGGLTLDSGSVLNVQFDSSSNDKIVVSNSGGLTINGGSVSLLDTTTSGVFSTAGTYTIAQYTGTLNGAVSNLSVASTSQLPGYIYTFSASGGNINLTIAASGVVRKWNVDASGSWATASNWDGTVPNGAGATANFTTALSTERTVTLDSDKTIGSLNFGSAIGYTIASGTPSTSKITLSSTTGSNVLVSSGAHTISAPVAFASATNITINGAANSFTINGITSGSANVTKTGSGALNFGASSTRSGATSLAGGSTSFISGGLGSGDLTLDGTKLSWASGNTQDITASRAVAFGDNAVTLDIAENNVTLSNDMGGSGVAAVTKLGTGTLTITGDMTFGGDFTISEGVLKLGNGGTTGSFNNVNIVNNATLEINRSDDISFFQVISGTGDLVHSGSGSTTINTTNTFSGATQVNNGTLILANTGALQNSTVYNSGSGVIDISNLSAVTFGALDGNNAISLTNASSTAIALTVGGNNGSTSYSGIISGSGSFTKTGTGAMTLNGANSYTGSTTVNGGGSLTVDNGGVINGGAVNVSGNAKLYTYDGSSITSSVVSNISNGGNASADYLMSGGTATYSAGLTANGNGNNRSLIQVDAGTINASFITLGRTSLVTSAEPTTVNSGNGLFVNGGTVNVTGAFSMGTSTGANSSVVASIAAGALNVGGAVTVGLNNGGRWSGLEVRGGTFTSTDTTSGVILGAATQGNALLLISGGDATVERIQYGQGTVGGTHVVSLTSGNLYVGTGGIVIGDSTGVATLRLSGGTLGAKGDWATALNPVISNTVTIKAADASDSAHNIQITGVVSGTGNLVKTGAGTLSLDATNTYTGNTTVNAGTLSLATASLNDTAVLNIASGATLNLPNAGTDTVGEFQINGVAQAAGTWGAIGSGAAHQTASITGSGFIKVVGSDPYDAWIANYSSLTGSNALKTADPDGDGQNNLTEFALNSDPSSSSASGKVSSSVATISSDQYLVITLPVRDTATFSGSAPITSTIDKIVYEIQGSTDLSSWTASVVEVTPALSSGLPSLDTGWTYRTFRLSTPVSSAAKGFLRIGITEAP